MQQLAFDFRPTAIDLSHALVIMRWRHHLQRDVPMLEAHWPAFGLTSWFYNWPEALAHVFAPGVNDHVRMRVRA